MAKVAEFFKKVSFKGVLTLDYNDEKQRIIQKDKIDFLINQAIIDVKNLESEWHDQHNKIVEEVEDVENDVVAMEWAVSLKRQKLEPKVPAQRRPSKVEVNQQKLKDFMLS